MEMAVNGGISQLNFIGGLLNILDSAKELFSFAGPIIKRNPPSSSKASGGGRRK